MTERAIDQTVAPKQMNRQARLFSHSRNNAGCDPSHTSAVNRLPGEFHSFDFKRAELPLAGALGADRAQVRVEIRRRFFPGITSRISQGELDGAPAAVEIFKDGTGKTTILISQKPKEIVVVGSK
jgi:hypothetical protein